MNLHQLNPKVSDRAVFIGQTGTGKSTLARYLLRQRQACIVLDVNDSLDWHIPNKDYPKGEYLVITSIEQLIDKQDYPRLIFKPAIEDSENFELFDLFFKTVFLMGKVTVYIDEAYAVTKNQSIPFYYKACLTRGRVKGIETWTATQRPSFIPSFILSESENAYVFKLRYPADVKKVSEYTGLEQEKISSQPKRVFCYSGTDNKIYNLKLKI